MTILEVVTTAVEHRCEALTISDIPPYRCTTSATADRRGRRSVPAMPVICVSIGLTMPPIISLILEKRGVSPRGLLSRAAPACSISLGPSKLPPTSHGATTRHGR